MHEEARVELSLIKAGGVPMFWVLIIAVVLIGFGVAFFSVSGHVQGRDVVPPFIGVVIVILLTPFVVTRVVSQARVGVEHGELVLHTGVGKKSVPLSNLRKHGLQIIDLRQHPQRRPIWRWWGVSMPGLSSGWFTLRNGEKSLCMLTDRSRVSWLRSDADNVTLLLSLEHPATLKALLER